jgi:hypothetical protein
VSGALAAEQRAARRDVEDLIEAVTGGQATAVKIVLASVLLED